MIGLIFFIGIAIGAFGGILMKLGASQVGPVEINSFNTLMSFLYKMLTNLMLVSGMFLYFVSGMTWSYLLTRLDISFVQPILALTYVATPVLAIFILNEHVSAMRWLGIFVIILGVFIVARTAGA